MSSSKLSLYRPVIHCKVTFERLSGYGAELCIIRRLCFELFGSCRGERVFVQHFAFVVLHLVLLRAVSIS